MDRKAVATTKFFGVSADTIINIVNKFVRKSVKEQDEVGCTKITESFAAGAEGADRYRITIIGAYNHLQNGGELKTDRCFAHITIESMGYNGRYNSFSSNRVENNGLSTEEFATLVYEGIITAYWDYMVVTTDWDSRAEAIIADYEQEQMSIIVGRYQQEFNGYMEDLRRVAEFCEDIDTAIDTYAAREIIKKMMQVSMDCYTALEEFVGCNSMGWDDGWHIDTTALGRWYDRTNNWMDDDDMAELVSTLDLEIAESGMPLGLEQDDLNWIADGGEVGLYPFYLWYEGMREFALNY